MLRFRSPVQTELAHGPQDVYHALSPQLLAKDGGGDEAAGSTNPSAANRDRDHWREAETKIICPYAVIRYENSTCSAQL